LLVLTGGLFGLLAGALVAFGLEWLAKDIIRSGRDIERYAGLAVLGSIPIIATGKKSNTSHLARIL
jgi:capsular polysaccharide biosynthesis protein